MRQMNFGNSTEWSFWGNVEYATDSEAKKARDAKYRELCKVYGKAQVRRWTLNGQMSKYSGFGQPDGRIGNAYKVTLNHVNQTPRESQGHNHDDLGYYDDCAGCV